MKPRRVVIAALYINVIAFSATAETAYHDRPQPCAIMVPKVIRLTAESKRLDDHIVIYYAARERGWASRRLLARFNVDGAALDEPRGGCARRPR